MLITQRLTRPVFHVSKELFLRRITRHEKDEIENPKILLFGEINWIVSVGIIETTFYYGIEFNRILN